VKTDAVKFMKA